MNAVHDRPVPPFDWTSLIRYVGAYGGLAIIGYFVYGIFVTKHLDRTFKFGSIAVIVVIGIVGAIAILQRDPPDETIGGERLYTAAEVAELLNAVRSAGGRFVEAANVAPATCLFCGRPGADVHGLDGTRYHRRCFQAAYREREENTRRR